MKKKKKTFMDWFSSGYLTLILLFIYVPIGYVVLFSFNESKSLSHFTGFSTQWYVNMFQDRTMMQSVYYTVLVAVVATVVSTVMGTLAAIGISKNRKIIRTLILETNNLPVMNPDIVTAIGMMLLFISAKVQLSLVTLILSHITFCTPYVILTIMPKLRQLDDNVAEAAMDLGATPWQALIKVILPQISSAIISGALIAFSMSFDDFVISFFTAGVGINNISMFVYSMKRYNPSVNALSTLIVVVVTLILVLANVIPAVKGKSKKEEEDL